MSWIRTIDPEAATGELARIYDEASARAGNVPNITKLQSLRPATMAAGFALYRQVMDGAGGLSHLQRVLIATVVSKVNGCHY